ncbi:hypothetical protein L1987_54935 [Smallanthus sonchifolius]|uniref:Uncharacterized protein n=1 Tax=Smallanthus sonchifolius TaxID=185202 RepID=A0ACB9E8X2_9ASTR|nr:hypothetical protein L1987_54935 [Smallanthus sonchifolius]
MSIALGSRLEGAAGPSIKVVKVADEMKAFQALHGKALVWISEELGDWIPDCLGSPVVPEPSAGNGIAVEQDQEEAVRSMEDEGVRMGPEVEARPPRSEHVDPLETGKEGVGDPFDLDRFLGLVQGKSSGDN